ncbi:MAG: CotH kinase family protein [Promethearchaeota archaeon]|jgi:spore coat protein CotH
MSDLLEKSKPSRLKRELIPFLIISVITISTFVYFSYQASSDSILYSPEVPIINIKVSDEVTNSSQQGFLKISPISNEFVKSRWANHYLAVDIRRRDSDGGFSFELYQNENLFQIRDDDDWILIPSGNNLNALRTKMAFDVYNMLQGNNSNCKLPHSKLVEVYINEVYQGLYLLSERIDRKFMDLEQENVINLEENDMIFKATNWDGDFYIDPTISISPWEQMYPNTLDFSQIPIDLTEFINNASEEVFFNGATGIFTFFDKISLIDNLLFGLFVGHEIIEGSSYYLIFDYDSTAGYFFIPWYFAQSWGFSEHGTIPIDFWLNSGANRIESVVWSKLFHRLLFPNNSSINDEFITEIINRWSYLRLNYWDTDDIIEHFRELYIPIQNSLTRTFNGVNSVESIIETIEDWIRYRCASLDNILTVQPTIFIDNFKEPIRADANIFGFSTPSARRHFFKSSLLFSTLKIHEVNVIIQTDYLNDMMLRKHDGNRWTNRLFMPADVSIDDYSIENVGFRVRANYNVLYPKDSFKLKFSETELYIGDSKYSYAPENENRRFFGLRRLNIRAAPTDYSFMNEMASYEIYKILGYPCPRTSWAKLYLTETDETGDVVKSREYKGLYLLTEDIDKTFLNYNFKNPTGNLYKTTDLNANLVNLPSIKNYFSWDGRRVYELRTNEEQDNYSDLEKFIQYINYNWSNIQDVTNIDLLSRYFAASNFIGNWDDYVFLPHNYFLYSDPNYGFIFLPWDVEQTLNMGHNSMIAFGAPDFRNASLLLGYEHWYDAISIWAQISPSPRPLWDNAITDSDFIDAYLTSHEEIVNNSASLILQVEQWFDFIKPTVIIPFDYTDPYPVVGYPIQIHESYFNYDKSRVLTYLVGRTQFVFDNYLKS